jgi:hypothetical protein
VLLEPLHQPGPDYEILGNRRVVELRENEGSSWITEHIEPFSTAKRQ